MNKERMCEFKMEGVQRIGFGISKVSMEVFATADGELLKTHQVKDLGVLYPLLNIGNGSKLSVFFDE
jgi:hypothetical protein